MDLSGVLSGGVAGSLHIEGDGDKIEVTPVLTSGEKIATITINEGTDNEQVIDLYAPEGFSGSWNDLTDKPTLFSGVYADLTSKPTLNGDTINGNMFTNNYLTNEIIVGTWIDGKPIYQKTFVFDNAITLANVNTWYSTPIICSNYNMSKIIDAIAYSPTMEDVYKGITAEINTGQYLQVLNYRYAIIQTMSIQYTKTTD